MCYSCPAGFVYYLVAYTLLVITMIKRVKSCAKHVRKASTLVHRVPLHVHLVIRELIRMRSQQLSLTQNFSASAGSTSCEFCPSGTYLPTTGGKNVSFCIPCAIGSYAGGTNSILLIFVQVPGMINCTLAPAGTFVPVSRSSEVSLCAQGTYQSLTGQSYCVSCAAGYYSGAIGATSISTCTACNSGTFSIAVGATSVRY